MGLPERRLRPATRLPPLRLPTERLLSYRPVLPCRLSRRSERDRHLLTTPSPLRLTLARPIYNLNSTAIAFPLRRRHRQLHRDHAPTRTGCTARPSRSRPSPTATTGDSRTTTLVRRSTTLSCSLGARHRCSILLALHLRLPRPTPPFPPSRSHGRLPRSPHRYAQTRPSRACSRRSTRLPIRASRRA